MIEPRHQTGRRGWSVAARVAFAFVGLLIAIPAVHMAMEGRGGGGSGPLFARPMQPSTTTFPARKELPAALAALRVSPGIDPHPATAAQPPSPGCDAAGSNFIVTCEMEQVCCPTNSTCCSRDVCCPESTRCCNAPDGSPACCAGDEIERGEGGNRLRYYSYYSYDSYYDDYSYSYSYYYYSYSYYYYSSNYYYYYSSYYYSPSSSYYSYTYGDADSDGYGYNSAYTYAYVNSSARPAITIGAIIGIVIGVSAVISIVSTVTVCIVRRSRRHAITPVTIMQQEIIQPTTLQQPGMVMIQQQPGMVMMQQQPGMVQQPQYIQYGQGIPMQGVYGQPVAAQGGMWVAQQPAAAAGGNGISLMTPADTAPGVAAAASAPQMPYGRTPQFVGMTAES